MSTTAHSAAFAPPAPNADGRIELLGLTRDELKQTLVGLGLEPFRAKQVYSWIYQHGARDFDAMTSLAKPVREKLAAACTIMRPGVARAQKSTDGTQKWLLEMPGKQTVECVHIPDPDEDRGALCVSSQVGCTLTCRFCHTGTQKLVRNLSAAEILAQIVHTRDELHEWPSSGQLTTGSGNNAPRDRLFTNIVMMGMGEPLYNYDNVAKALKIVMDEEGLAISKRRITLSTSGVVPLIERCGAELGVNLAVSLHATNDELRSSIMPINRKYPLAELMHAIRNYPGSSNARRITFEYVMLKGINDSDADAHALVELIGDLPAKVNLIPFNTWPGAPYECSSNNRIHRFADIINAAGFSSPIRTARGEDIMAACGQLKSDSVRMSVAQRQLMEATIAEKEAAAGF